MDEPGYFVADHGFNPKFLFQFTAERVAGLLPFLNLAAREFPFKWHDLVTGTLAGKNLVTLEDESCDDAFDAMRDGFSSYSWPLAKFCDGLQQLAARYPRSWLCFELCLFQALADELSAIFDELAIFETESGREMTVNVEFSGHLPVREDRDAISDLVSTEHAR